MSSETLLLLLAQGITGLVGYFFKRALDDNTRATQALQGDVRNLLASQAATDKAVAVVETRYEAKFVAIEERVRALEGA